MSEAAAIERDRGFWKNRGAAALWTALAIGPFAWALDVGISYPMVKWECGNHVTWPLHVVSVAAALVAVCGWLLAWWCLRHLPAQSEVDGGSAFDRGRFMAIAGLVLNAMFFMVVVANAVPRLLIGPCQQ